jgi:hypothetical protein
VIRSDKPELFCCGHMITPENWPAALAIETTLIEELTKEKGLTEATPELAEELSREYPTPVFSRNFDGITTDD